ncbi:MAG: hypothetical protein M3Y72_15520 [Acidobacteriota bacterium]|nr:hypothetical protein [Acidobacteriota bacterium]
MVVFSIIWAVAAGIHTHNTDVESAESFAKFAYKTCTDSKVLNNDPDLSSCDSERIKNLNTWMNGDRGNVLFTALAPIPAFWLGVLILAYVARAQIVGFRAVVPWGTLPRFKKTFVVFCGIVTLATLLFAVVVVLNLEADRAVPVGLSTFLDVTRFGDSVTVQGTWTRTDLTNDTIMNPIQTSKIECDKAQNRCIEATASVSSGSSPVLMSDITEYDIQSWTADAIVMRRDDTCTTEVFTIDLNTNTVSGAGHRINENQTYCVMNKGDRQAWSYQLVKGFDVYWHLRQNARPLMLRVFQSFFGN